jgi:hypothetical protein
MTGVAAVAWADKVQCGGLFKGIWAEVVPIGILGFDKIKFLFSAPRLDLLFAGDSRMNIGVSLKIN